MTKMESSHHCFPSQSFLEYRSLVSAYCRSVLPLKFMWCEVVAQIDDPAILKWMSIVKCDVFGSISRILFVCLFENQYGRADAAA